MHIVTKTDIDEDTTSDDVISSDNPANAAPPKPKAPKQEKDEKDKQTKIQNSTDEGEKKKDDRLDRTKFGPFIMFYGKF